MPGPRDLQNRCAQRERLMRRIASSGFVAGVVESALLADQTGRQARIRLARAVWISGALDPREHIG